MNEDPSQRELFQPDRFIEDLRNIPKTRFRDQERYTEVEWRRGNLTTGVQNVVVYADRLRGVNKLQEAFEALRQIHPDEEEFLRLHLEQLMKKHVFTKDELPWITTE